MHDKLLHGIYKVSPTFLEILQMTLADLNALTFKVSLVDQMDIYPMYVFLLHDSSWLIPVSFI